MGLQQELSQTLTDWDKAAAGFEQAVVAAAEAKSKWERFAAKTRLSLKADAEKNGRKLTVPDLDASILAADMDGLSFDVLIADAHVTAQRKRLDVFEHRVDVLRSFLASERERQKAWEASPAVPQVQPSWSNAGER